MSEARASKKIYPSLEDNASKETITVISNQEDILCNDPVYHAGSGSVASDDNIASCIVAQPRSALRFEEVCYVQLGEGPTRVAIGPQDDGSISIDGANVKRIARELQLKSAE